MKTIRHVAVIDIGKTNAKVALVDLETLVEIAVVKTPNLVAAGPPYPHFDIDGLWQFLVDGLAQFHTAHGVDAISVTTHGASIVLLDENGALATPMLDYEHTGPDDLTNEYDQIRPEFSRTGAPRLPMGLNLGAQIHWLFETQPGLRDRIRTIVTYPQYWVGRLTGVHCNEVTSLGCHTDLWEPYQSRFSSLVEQLRLSDKMAPVRKAPDRIGTLLPDVARQTGLPEDTPVYCGIHDSNASLYPHLLAHKPPFSVLSTGTWVIAMAVDGNTSPLDPSRDTLINVNALGDPVPSARFMGGREYELLMGDDPATATPDDVSEVLGKGIMLLPSVVPESGPFQGRKARWTHQESSLAPGQRAAVVSLYLALMAGTCLEMIGARGPTIAEGPFAKNPLFLDMLEIVTERPVVLPGGSATGTSIGAAMLVLDKTQNVAAEMDMPRARPVPAICTALKQYAAAWHALADQKDPQT